MLSCTLARRPGSGRDPVSHCVDETSAKPAGQQIRAACGYGSLLSRDDTSRERSLIIRPEIFRELSGSLSVFQSYRSAVQQRGGLGLVVRRDIVRLIDRLAQHVAIVLVGGRRADEDANAMLRLGIEIADLLPMR